jgi:hypothetical protein
VIGHVLTQSGVGMRVRLEIGRDWLTLHVVHPVRTLGLLALFLLAFGGGVMLEKEAVAEWMRWPEG